MSDDALVGRDTVIGVINDLVGELDSGADWENNSLGRFLEAFSALLGSIENSYTNAGKTTPGNPWIVMADALKGARYYE